jgi:hypothetical protein
MTSNGVYVQIILCKNRWPRRRPHQANAACQVVATDLTAHRIHHVVAHFGDESLWRLPVSGWMNLRMADFKVPISVDRRFPGINPKGCPK